MGLQRPVFLPAHFAVDGKLYGSPVRQIARPAAITEAEVIPYRAGRNDGFLVVHQNGAKTLVLPRPLAVPASVDAALLLRDVGDLPRDAAQFEALNGRHRWLQPMSVDVSRMPPSERDARWTAARESWKDRFSFREEVRDGAGNIVEYGLRPPQIGALHAVLAHWKVTDDPATVVMPTGTGKTETMLSLLLWERPDRLLVVVPNAALREQISGKFLTLGLLKDPRFRVAAEGALYPVVGVLEHQLKSPDEVATFFGACNVVVTTIQVVSGCGDEVQRAMAEACSHLFIDEAHHVSAPTWEKFRRFFTEKRVIQFTATPFRSDGKHVDGKAIFTYPLRKAQEEDYFRPIEFVPLNEFDPALSDRRIAEEAIRCLEADVAKGFDHLLMARTAKIARAEQVHALYEGLAPAHRPLLITNDVSERERRRMLQDLRSRRSRVVVCVDMFGEGFDLPELKVAALHDIHKSLAITLQFTGRFTRTRPDIGRATVVANIANANVADYLQDLYAQDADWNQILPYLSLGATKRHERQSAFLKGFTDVPPEIPLQNVFPKMSAVVYRVRRDTWRPDGVKDAVKESRLYAGPTVNHAERVLLFITREREPVRWGNVKDIQNTQWDLYLVHFDEAQKLLFINSSNNEGEHEELAKAIGGDDVELIKGETVFRSMHGINRLILMNLGLTHSLSRAVRFSMYVGADIRQGLTDSHTLGKRKTNIFGLGFEGGDKASVGCSGKGRVWSYKIAYDMTEWVEWCRQVGAKLLDDSISTASVFSNLVVPTTVTTRPAGKVPLTIEWSEEFFKRSEDCIFVEVDGDRVPFYEAGMELVERREDDPLRFRVFTENKSAEYEVRFNADTVEYVPMGTAAAEIEMSRRTKPLSAWFQTEPPVIRFSDGAFLIYNELFEVPNSGPRTPFDPGRIQTWDWTGVDLTKESQTTAKRSDSIQYKVIQALKAAGHDPQYDIVFDDDASGEAADIVAIKAAGGERLIVHLFHCKFSKDADPGARVKDLYEVCGQAQRSAFWKGNVRGLLGHLRRREANRMRSKTPVSRFEAGDMAKLAEITREAPFLDPEFTVFVVQPGVSRAEVTTGQLDLLAATELYLMETYNVGLQLIASS